MNLFVTVLDRPHGEGKLLHDIGLVVTDMFNKKYFSIYPNKWMLVSIDTSFLRMQGPNWAQNMVVEQIVDKFITTKTSYLTSRSNLFLK